MKILDLLKFMLILNIFSATKTFAVDSPIVWKYGIAFINDGAKYIDPDKLKMSEMTTTKNWIVKNKKEKKDIIKSGRLIWKYDGLMTYNTFTQDPYSEILESESIYHYKVSNNKMYLSKDGKDWDELHIKIVDDKPKYGKPRVDPPVYMIIYLKCKWFEGEYELLGSTG